MDPDQVRRLYVLVRSLVVLTAGVFLAGVLTGMGAPLTGRPEADGSFAIAMLGGALFVFIRRGYRWERSAGAADSIQAAAIAADQTMWIVLGLGLGAMAASAAYVAHTDDELERTALCTLVAIVLLAKGASRAWQARRYVTGANPGCAGLNAR